MNYSPCIWTFFLLYIIIFIVEGRLFMNKNKLILQHCKNFYKIKEFEYDEDDYITEKLINTYEDYIFNIDENNEEALRRIEILDSVIFKYIDDYNFRKEIKKRIYDIKISRKDNVLDSIVNALIGLFENYEEGYTRNIYFARWI